MRAALVGLVVVAFAIGALLGDVSKHPRYTPDGMVYARYAARDAGYGDREAVLKTRAFYLKTPLMGVPRYRALVEMPVAVAFQRSRIFANRLLYPWIVSLLLPVAGFKALFLVSWMSYVAFGIVLFWMLAAFGRPWIAAFVAIVALALPVTRELAASDLTDMLAAVWWTGALGALLHYMQRPRRSLLFVLAIASVLLTLTRPAPYLVVLPAFALAVVRGAWLPLAASFAGVAAFAAVAMGVHAFGLREQLRWAYEHEARPGAGSQTEWYRSSLAESARFTISRAVRTVLPVVLLAAMVYGAVRLRVRDEMLVLAAAGAACLLGILFNPIPSALSRVVFFPLVPVFCAIAQAMAASLPSFIPAARPTAPAHD